LSSVPKAGTHLALRVMSLIRGSAHQWVTINPHAYPTREITEDFVRKTIPSFWWDGSLFLVSRLLNMLHL